MLISASFGLCKGPPQTCTVARGDPSHFVDAFKGFTLMAWMKQSRSDVGIFFVEDFKVRPTSHPSDDLPPPPSKFRHSKYMIVHEGLPKSWGHILLQNGSKFVLMFWHPKSSFTKWVLFPKQPLYKMVSKDLEATKLLYKMSPFFKANSLQNGF